MADTRGAQTKPVIEAARRHERWAEEEIARIIQGFARHVCRPHASSRLSEPEWEDVAQEASRRFFASGLERFRPGGPERSYLYSIVKATRIQLYRSMTRRTRRENETGADVAGRPAPSPESKTLLFRIVGRLSESCRDLLQRAFFDGASHAELAMELGMAESSVRSKLTRCLQKAREIAA